MAENKKPKYDEEFKKSIVQLYKDGVSKSSISKEHGVSQSTLNNWIKKYGDLEVIDIETSKEDVRDNYCRECGEKLVEGSKFCSSCGAKQTESEIVDNKETENVKTDFEETRAQSDMNDGTFAGILGVIRKRLTKDEQTKANVKNFQVLLLILCIMGLLFALVVDSSKAFVIAILQIGFIAISFLVDKGIIKTDKLNIELIPAVIVVFLIFPYFIGLFSMETGNESTYKKNSNIDWTQIELADVLPTPASTSGYIETDSMYGFEVTLDAVLPEQYDAYIDKCKDAGFDVDIETGVLKYKAYNDDGYRLELSYSKATEQLEIILFAPESMEDLIWNDLRISKILPEPKSLYGDVAEEDEVTEITLGKMTKEDLKEYVNACKEKGFDLESTETATTYRAKNKDGYLLECKYNGGNIVKISIAEPLYNIKLELTCRENLWFSKYDVEVFVDGESLGYIDHGTTKTFDLKLKAGKYELRVCEKGNSSVDGTYTFLVAKDQTKKYKISCAADQISVTKNEEEKATTEVEKTTVAPTTTTTTRALVEGEIRMPRAESDYHYDNYEEVVTALKKLGFKNVTTKASYELDTNFIDKSVALDVKSVTIDGKASFEAGHIFKNDVEVVVLYRDFKISDPSISYTKYTAKKILDDMEANAYSASEKYNGQLVEVTGYVRSIESNGDLWLCSASNPYALICLECHMMLDSQEEKVAEMSVGDTVTVRGKITIANEFGYTLEVYSIP